MVLPQRTQIEIEFALVVHEQGTVALALHHRTAVSRLQAEVVLLPLRVIAVITDPVLYPVPHPLAGKALEQSRYLV